MRIVTACMLAALFACVSSCAILGFDFSDPKPSGTTGGAAGAGAGAPTLPCGGLELLPGLDRVPALYSPLGDGGTGCRVLRAGGGVTLEVKPNATAGCSLVTPWVFEAHGRRYSARITSPVEMLGGAHAGLFAIDSKGTEVALQIGANGQLALTAQAPGKSISIASGSLNASSRVALRFDEAGHVFAETARDAAPDVWIPFATNVDVGAQLKASFDASALDVGTFVEPMPMGTSAGSATFDEVVGAIVDGSPSPGACPASSLRDDLTSELPSTLGDAKGCTVAGSGLELCAKNGMTYCVVASRRLYRLEGSSLSVRVQKFSAPKQAIELGAYVPGADTPLAGIVLDNEGHVAVEPPLNTIAGGIATPIVLEIATDDHGGVSYGWQASPDAGTTQVATGTFLTQQLVSIQLRAKVPSAGTCVTVDHLGVL